MLSERLTNMKNLLLVIVALLVGGCATPLTPEQKALRDSVAGVYELKKDGDTGRLVYLDNGIAEGYKNGKKYGEFKWKLTKEGELHVTDPNGDISVWRINEDSSITGIAVITKDEKRIDLPKEYQTTYKRIKSIEEFTFEEKVIGEYESKQNGITLKFIFHRNYISELYANENMPLSGKWEIGKDGETHIEWGGGDVTVFRLNKDGNITTVAYMDKDGKRNDIPKEQQPTYKKIK